MTKDAVLSPILLQVFKNRFSSIAEEMGVALTRTAFSPNIKERRDLSCAVFDPEANMVAQAAHIPVHLGSMPLSVAEAVAGLDLEDGDMALLNDPFRGGTHLPDVTVAAPVFCRGFDGPAFYTANRAHHADVGGMTPGSMPPLSTRLHQEGIIIPPVKIVRRGEVDSGLMRLILANVRTPAEREGDFSAQFMAARTGVRRLHELAEAHGPETLLRYARGLMDHAEAMMRAAIRAIPDGTYDFEDFLDGGGLSRRDIGVRVRLTVRADNCVADFTASDDQAEGSINAVRAITLSAVLYVFRCLGPTDAPTNAGCMRPIEVLTRPGSVVDAKPPAAVAGGNVETSQRIVDVLLGALAQALPERIPAASQGTMNNVTIGGVDARTGRPFAYYETLAGGMGAFSGGDGESAVHSHMTNTLNTPVEALEYAYPFLVNRYAVRRGSGGAGAYRGGDGLVREITLLSEADASVLSERRTRAPYGLQGGEPGAPGKNVVIRDGEEQEMDGKFTVRLKPGDRLKIETPGGGGWGAAKEGFARGKLDAANVSPRRWTA
jgi:N-methylhydantoinase B